MQHKISRDQYDQLASLPSPSLCEYFPWHGANRLLAGEGTDADLQEVVDRCIKHDHTALARELLLPPESWS